MKANVIIGVSILALPTCLSFAQDFSPPPTRVCQPGIYGCPTHADILATWSARCPLCETVLKTVPSSASTVVGVTPAADRYSQQPGEAMREAQQEQQWRQRQRQNEQWREWGQRNEQLRQQARRNAERREQLRRNEELGQPAPDLDYRPPEGYAYPYPYNYQYNPRTGRYEYLRPGPNYPYGGYQYNPNPGLRYYNPNADQYYYNPNMGHYFYNPHTGQYEYVNPRYAFTPISIIDPGIVVGPGIDMDNRRRDEDEKARAAQRKEQLEEQARRDAELWGWYPSYGYVPPGSYPYPDSPPGYIYQYPYNYDSNPNPGYVYPYGGFFYNPNTGQFYYRPKAGPYYYNPNTGQYEYRNPGYAYPDPRIEERRERGEQQHR